MKAVLRSLVAIIFLTSCYHVGSSLLKSNLTGSWNQNSRGSTAFAAPETALNPGGSVKVCEQATPQGQVLSPPEETIIKSIKFQRAEKENVERVLIQFSRSTKPDAYTLDGGKPRIVIDVKDVHAWDGDPEVPIDGQFVVGIRTHLHRDSNKLRIVVDLKPTGSYIANPVYFEKDHIFSVQVRSALE